MAFGSGSSSVNINDILDKVTEADILSFYLGIKDIPCIIHSPLRKDKKPSFGFYSPDGNRIFYHDFSTRDTGGIYDFLGLMWGCDYRGVIERINKDMGDFQHNTNVISKGSCKINAKGCSTITALECKVREWREYDIEYWESYGVPLKWLKYAEVYPISHKIIVKNGQRYIFGADKYAYAYVEHKEGKVTLKIYQPFNKEGYKWNNKHDKSVISLWTKVPMYGDKICICSSLKDALCLWANTGIPSLALQGEGYEMSNTAISELKRRYKHIFILFDNDKAGLEDGQQLSELTGFTNLVLPKFEEYSNPKDISDLYYTLQNKEKFKEILLELFKDKV